MSYRHNGKVLCAYRNGLIFYDFDGLDLPFSWRELIEFNCLPLHKLKKQPQKARLVSLKSLLLFFFVRIFAHSMKRVQSKFSQKGLSLCGYVTICLGLPLLFENMLKIQLDVSQIGHICVPANWQTDCGLRIVGGLCEVLLCGVFCNWNLPHACESGHAAAHGNPGRCDRAAASCRPGPSASPRWCPWVAPVER